MQLRITELDASGHPVASFVNWLGDTVPGFDRTTFTGAPVWRSGGRQLLLGLAAAGLTFGVGKLIGMAIA